jgi:membrane associated rhomboid family serine protease
MNDQQYSPSGFSLLPPVVKNLLIINILFFVATIAFKNFFDINLKDILGLHYYESDQFHPYQIFTYMFMHGDFTHLFFNMFALWMFGNSIENIWGGKRFLVYYLITGIGAALTHYIIFYFQISPDLHLLDACIQNPIEANVQNLVTNHSFYVSEYSGAIWTGFQQFQHNVQLLSMGDNSAVVQESINAFLVEYREYYLSEPNIIGASGSVFGILLAFGMLFPNVRIYVYFLFPLKAKWFVIIYGALELYFGVSGTNDGIAHFAHLGGMLFGIILILLWRKRNNNQLYEY